MSHDNIDGVIEELFESILCRCQIGFETSMKCSDFIFDCVNLLYCKCHKKNSNRGGSSVVPLNWTKLKNSTINYIIKSNNKYFQYVTLQ